MSALGAGVGAGDHGTTMWGHEASIHAKPPDRRNPWASGCSRCFALSSRSEAGRVSMSTISLAPETATKGPTAHSALASASVCELPSISLHRRAHSGPGCELRAGATISNSTRDSCSDATLSKMNRWPDALFAIAMGRCIVQGNCATPVLPSPQYDGTTNGEGVVIPMQSTASNRDRSKHENGICDPRGRQCKPKRTSGQDDAMPTVGCAVSSRAVLHRILLIGIPTI